MTTLVSNLNRKLLPVIVVQLVLAAGVSSAGAECPNGDLDDSGDVGLADYAAFADCTTGPGGGPVQPGCEPVDFDTDADVDLLDFGEFQRIFGAPLGGHR